MRRSNAARGAITAASLQTARSLQTLPTDIEEPPPPEAGIFGLEKLAHQLPLFRECSYDFVESIIGHMRKMLCRPGQVMVEQGSAAPRAMYLVLWGSADLACQGQPVTTLVEGGTFGEAQMLGLFDKWGCSVTVTTSCMLCELTEANLKEELKNYPDEAEYFNSIIAYYAIRNEEWTEKEVRLSLRHAISFRQASEEMLAELEQAMERRLFFAGDCLFTEGECSSNLGLVILHDGEVVMEVAGRVVRTREVPHVTTKSVVSESWHDSLRRKSGGEGEGRQTLTGDNVSESAAWKQEGEEADAMLEKSSNLGTYRGSSDVDLPEAAVFGEEVFIGASKASTITVRARKLCDVRILHRHQLDRVIEKYPEEAKMLAEQFLHDPDEAFPPLQTQEARLFGGSCEVSEDFVDFLKANVEERIFFPGDYIKFDSLDENLPKSAIMPFLNHTFGRLNVGHVRAILPNNAEQLEDLRPNQILGPGSTIKGSACWAGILFQALEVCYVSVLHRGCISRALEEFALDRERVIPVLVMQHQEATQEKIPSKAKSHKQERVAKILRERSIFASASQAFLAEILQFGTIRVFMPGDRVIEQGADGTDMFILSVGIASVVKESMDEIEGQITRTLTNIGGLTYGSVFGELVMLGVQSKRSASIVASSVCCTWEVQHKAILGILDRHPPERANFLKLVEEHLDKLAAPRIIYHQLFTGFSQQFRTLVGVNCERKLYFPGETVVREGSSGDRMFIVNLGSASVEVAGQHVMQIRGGSHIGFNMISSSADKEKHFATVVTETMCQVLMITRSAYQHALHVYPNMQAAAQQLEAEEKSRAKKMQNGIMKLVHRRRGLRFIIDALRDGLNSRTTTEAGAANRPMLESVFQGWLREVQRCVEQRKEEEQLRLFNDKQIATWLDNRKRQMDKQRPHKELQRLLRRNLVRRGPLKMPLPSLARKTFQKTAFVAPLGKTHGSTGMPPAGKLFESQAFLHHEGISPYTAPAVVWRRVPQSLGPQSARTPRSLPPMQDAMLHEHDNTSAEQWRRTNAWY